MSERWEEFLGTVMYHKKAAYDRENDDCEDRDDDTKRV